jgi:drug/metabolite transporter (DMT)-like permease
MAGSSLIWLTPALLALFLYGIGQGLVKQWIAEVPPARYCLYFILAKAMVNLGYFFSQPHPPLFAPESMKFAMVGFGAYLLDGIGWAFYFEAIVSGPISVIGTLSAAYPALTVLLAKIFLQEKLQPMQNWGVVFAIAGCLGLSYAPADPNAKFTGKSWLVLSLLTVLFWGVDQTIVKYSYGLPGANEVNMAVFNTLGEAVALGTYIFLRRRERGHSLKELSHSALPMAMLAGGDLGVLVASRSGPISIVSPLTGAYPVVTLIYAATILKESITKIQWFCLFLILIGIVLCPGTS